MKETEADFDVFFSREYPATVRAIFVMTGDRGSAEEIAQEAFARSFARWSRISRFDRPDAWVRRVAVNLAISAMRRRPRFVDPKPADATHDQRIDLQRAIIALPRMQRAIVVLHYLEDRDIGECARLAGCSASTARVHLHRARKRLAELLEVEGVADGAR